MPSSVRWLGAIFLLTNTILSYSPSQRQWRLSSVKYRLSLRLSFSLLISSLVRDLPGPPQMRMSSLMVCSSEQKRYQFSLKYMAFPLIIMLFRLLKGISSVLRGLQFRNQFMNRCRSILRPLQQQLSMRSDPPTTRQNFSSFSLGQLSKMMVGEMTSFSAMGFFLMNLSLPPDTSQTSPEKKTFACSFSFPKIMTQCLFLQRMCLSSTKVNFLPIPCESKSFRVSYSLSSIRYKLMYFLSMAMKQSLGSTRTAFGLSSFSFFFVLFLIIQNTISSFRLYLTGRQKVKDEMFISLMVSRGCIRLWGIRFFLFIRRMALVIPSTVPKVLMIEPSSISSTGEGCSPMMREVRLIARKLLKMCWRLELDSSVAIFLFTASFIFLQPIEFLDLFPSAIPLLSLILIMGFIKIVALIAAPVAGMTYAAFTLGKQLPKASRKMGNYLGLGYVYFKSALKVIKPEDQLSYEMIAVVRRASQQSQALRRQLRNTIKKAKQDFQRKQQQSMAAVDKSILQTEVGIPIDKEPINEEPPNQRETTAQQSGSSILEEVERVRSRIKSQKREKRESRRFFDEL